jgi:uncharacterized surface protein with fasciclin (FAS1) repeats
MTRLSVLFVGATALAASIMTVLARTSDNSFSNDVEHHQYHEPPIERKTLRRRAISEQQLQVLEKQRSIDDIVKQTIALGTFEKALKESGVEVLLSTIHEKQSSVSGRGDAAAAGVTILMPWNAAFETLPEGFLDRIMEREWSLHRQNLLLYHTYIGSLPYSNTQSSSSLSTASSTTTLKMANGETIVLYRDNNGNTMQFEHSNVVAYEAASNNGYAYVVDKVLAPSFMSKTIMDLLATTIMSPLPSSLLAPMTTTTSTSASTSTFATLIVTAALEDLLRHSTASLTVFCPSNEAFAALGEGMLIYLQSSDGAEILQEILTYHIVSGVYASVNMMMMPNENNNNGLLLPTLFNENTLTIAMDDENVFTVDGVPVVMADALAVNGIIHVIAKVLTPPVPTSTTTAPAANPTTADTSGGGLTPLV